MRLIDADGLKSIMASPEYPCVLQTLLIGIIDAQPTAYDVDKVVEQLETDGKNTDVCISKKKAIEIVKSGGE